MNILASYRQQMNDHKNSILIYWLVIFILFILLDIVVFIFSGFTGGNTNSSSVAGNEYVSLIFLFVIGLCTFKETFLFSMQNGVSRKTLFCAKLLTMASVAAVISAADIVFHLLGRALASFINPGMESFTMYGTLYEGAEADSAVYLIPNFFMEFLLAMAAMAVGYFITIMFYRLHKRGKIIVGAGVPVFFNIVLPAFDFRFFDGTIMLNLGHLMVFAVSRPSHLFLSAALVFVVFSVASFLLMRKAVVKRS